MKRTNLTNARLANGWTLQQVAEYLEITRAAYGNIESGRRNPSIKVANALEDLFGIPQRKLLTKEGEELIVINFTYINNTTNNKNGKTLHKEREQ